jgi:hypothetical protein
VGIVAAQLAPLSSMQFYVSLVGGGAAGTYSVLISLRDPFSAVGLSWAVGDPCVGVTLTATGGFSSIMCVGSGLAALGVAQTFVLRVTPPFFPIVTVSAEVTSIAAAGVVLLNVMSVAAPAPYLIVASAQPVAPTLSIWSFVVALAAAVLTVCS